MRLDKFFTTVGLLSRRECAAAVRHGEITVNGVAARGADMTVEPEGDVVCYRGEKILYRAHTYLFLNKPAGYVSATEDGRYPVVTELVPPAFRRLNLFPCGRLDRDTVGLMLLTDDGALSHALLSPRRGIEKIYRFRCDAPLPPEAEERLLAGMTLGDTVCKSARLCAEADRACGTLALTEGKYHEVKRMMAALGCRVIELERIAFAGIPLDPTLKRGECRLCTEEEIRQLHAVLNR